MFSQKKLSPSSKKSKALYWLSLILFVVFASVALVSTYLVNSRSQEAKRSQASVGNDGTASLQDFWNDRAEWQLVNTVSLSNNRSWNSGFITHAVIKVSGDKWYLLSRTIKPATQTGCSFESLGMELRVSRDKGTTFSAPVTLVEPQPNTPWECGVTDGSLYYDEAKSKWLYLTQCIAKDGKWNGCLFEKAGQDPMAAFTPVPNNPVLKSGQLWSEICKAGTKCREIAGDRAVTDEGTFDIFEFRDGYYYVSFHGFANPYGFRGIAKTKNFRKWITTGNDLPNDAFLSKKEASEWRESWSQGESIGFGYAQTIKQNGDYYTIAEAADVSLLCTAGQNWNVGLVRSKNLRHDKIEQLPMGNPFYYSSKNVADPGKSLPCNVQYPYLFVSDSETYLSVLRSSENDTARGLLIYKLVKTENKLKNASFWKCNNDSWKRVTKKDNVTNLAIYRDPEKSSDRNCYLATNCDGPACTVGNSIYQDFKLTEPAAQLHFGLKAQISNPGVSGKARLVLWELGPAQRGHELLITDLSTEYKSYEMTVPINPETKNFRFEFYLQDPKSTVGDYRLDETFVRAK